MERSHQICIILMLIIIVSAGESGISPFPYPPHPQHDDQSLQNLDSAAAVSSPIAEPHRGPEGCHFPGRWEGSWFQSGVHQTITINRGTINTKGRCLESDGEKYLLINEKENCFRCVVFHEKHYNLIQYKETFCVPERASIRSLCSTITGDANLFAMFRLNAIPIDCPFRAPMTFTYNRGHGECRNPISTIESCLQPSQLLFNYQACPDTNTESSVEELQCLASWKEGSYRYLVGLVQYRHHASYEERFRCFVYEKVKKGGSSGLLGHQPGYSNTVVRSSPLTFNSTSGSGSGTLNSASSETGSKEGAGNNGVLFRVSQSGDATCNGLSPYEGSRTMTFRRALQSLKTCYFPSWVQIHPRFHTLDQKTVFVFNSTTMRMTNGSSGGSGASGTANVNIGSGGAESFNILASTNTAVCSQIVENPSPDEYTLVLHVTAAQCRNGYICSRLIRRDSHIVEIQIGTLTRQLEDACHPINFNPDHLPYTTLTSSNSAKKRCPSLGHFGITSLAQEGRSVRDTCQNGHRSFSVGCTSRNTMEFRMLCKNDARPEIVSEYSCHGWWEENGINYLITTLTPTQSSPTSRSTSLPRKYCFIYRDMPLGLGPLETKSKSVTYLQHVRNQEESFGKKSSLFLDGIEEVFQRGDQNQDEEHDFGRIMQFSSIADSCRRDISPGIEGFLAFNVTSRGRCNDISGSSILEQTTLVTELWLLAIIQMMIAIAMQ